MSRYDMPKKRERENSWWQEVRSRTYASHEFIKQTHCADCRKWYNRNWMRQKKESLLADYDY